MHKWLVLMSVALTAISEISIDSCNTYIKNFKANLISSGYFFSLDLVRPDNDYGTLYVYFDNEKTETLQVGDAENYSFGLYLATGLLSYTGFKEMKIVYQGKSILEENYQISGLSKEKTIAENMVFSKVFCTKNNQVILEKKISLVENEKLVIPDGFKTDIKRLAGLKLSDDSLVPYLNFIVTFGNTEFVSDISYSTEEEAYSLNVLSLLVNSADQLMAIKINMEYNEYANVNVSFFLTVLVKNVIPGNKEFGYHLVYGSQDLL